MRTLNELINSGLPLTPKEQKVVERNIFRNSKPISRYEYNSLKVMGGIQKTDENRV